jgi:hypothetical protein
MQWIKFRLFGGKIKACGVEVRVPVSILVSGVFPIGMPPPQPLSHPRCNQDDLSFLFVGSLARVEANAQSSSNNIYTSINTDIVNINGFGANG